MHSPPRIILATLFAAIGIPFVRSGIIDLEEFNWERYIGNGKPALVEFWAPWCDHCKDLVPAYEELAEVFDHVKDKFIIAKVNGDSLGSKSLVEKYQITGLPTIKWFHANGESEDYDSEAPRTVEDLAGFVTKKTGLKADLPPPPPPPPSSVTKMLTFDNFNEIVNDPGKDVLVVFTAPWCEHCKTLKPVYDLVAWNFRFEDHVILASYDGDQDPDHALTKKYNVVGYPILKLFPKGSSDKTPIDYKLSRDEKNIVTFLNAHTGTQRAVGGGLTDEAGRSEKLDDLASQFMSAHRNERKFIYKKAKQAAVSAGKAGKQYLRVMDKLVNGTDEYLTEEKKRLAKILRKRTLSDEKLDEVKIRSNILSAFASQATKKPAEGIKIERRPAEGSASSKGAATGTTSGAATQSQQEKGRVKEEL